MLQPKRTHHMSAQPTYNTPPAHSPNSPKPPPRTCSDLALQLLKATRHRLAKNHPAPPSARADASSMALCSSQKRAPLTPREAVAFKSLNRPVAPWALATAIRCGSHERRRSSRSWGFSRRTWENGKP